MTAWYYSDYERNRLGPVRAQDLADLHAGGQLQPDTLVWREGLAQWMPWRSLATEALAEAGRPASVAAASIQGGTRAIEGGAGSHGGNPYEVVERSPYAAPRAEVGDGFEVVGGHEVVYAGFWKRGAAYVIDAFAVGVVVWILQLTVMGVFFGISAGAAGDPGAMLAGAGLTGVVVGMILVPLALQAVYYAGFHASSKQATLGKMAIGIKVADEDGERISFARGLGRFFAAILSALILCIGYLMAAFTDRSRALHDMIASTLVVDQWAFTAHPERQRHELGTVATVILVVAGLLFLGYIAIIVLAIGVAATAGS
ncbi:MAG: RDD family protein [Pseudomonadota bacterium]|nr:RDD family protein [Pseudomonadota bacterium]